MPSAMAGLMWMWQTLPRSLQADTPSCISVYVGTTMQPERLHIMQAGSNHVAPDASNTMQSETQHFMRSSTPDSNHIGPKVSSVMQSKRRAAAQQTATMSHQKSARMPVCTISDSNTMAGQMPLPMACSRKLSPSIIWRIQWAQLTKRDTPSANT